MFETKSMKMNSIIASVVCYIVMVSNKVLTPQHTVEDATRIWEQDFDKNCESCPWVNKCALAISCE